MALDVTPIYRNLRTRVTFLGLEAEDLFAILAHWRSVKHVDEFNEEGEAEGETIIRKRERFSHELTLAYESGQIRELKETKEARVGNEKCS
jgi:hypothetical protein